MNKISCILLCSIITILSCSEKKTELNKKSKGEFSKTNKRIGKWEYYDDKGSISATGSYTDGLKMGPWRYDKKTYNDFNIIEWNIISNDSYKINLPDDWEFNKTPNSITSLLFKYNDSISPNGNITLIEERRDSSIDSVVTTLINQNKINNDYKLLLRENVEINGRESVYIQQILKVSNQELFIEQFIVEDSPNNYYLLSFFVRKNKIQLYHQLFSEIAYSFTFMDI